MSKPYSILREKMKPAARKKAADKTKALLYAMPLQELRHARNLSQEQLAQTLSVKQAAVSKLKKRTDMYISTLRNFIKAMGGDLEIIATFPDGSVQICQFKTLLRRQKEEIPRVLVETCEDLAANFIIVSSTEAFQ